MRARIIRNFTVCLFTVCCTTSFAEAVVSSRSTSSALVAQPQTPPRGFLPSNANPHGYSFTQLATAWARWAFGTAPEINPILTNRCEQSQLDPRIWFLPPSIGGEQLNICQVPQGSFLVFSPAGFECSEAEGNGSTEAELTACAEEAFPLITSVEVTLDGRTSTATDLTNYISTTLFDVLPPNNLISPNSTPTLTKGYFLVLTPLSRGTHYLRAFDEISSLGLQFGITYTIIVQ
jgi:hypothetical protein